MPISGLYTILLESNERFYKYMKLFNILWHNKYSTHVHCQKIYNLFAQALEIGRRSSFSCQLFLLVHKFCVNKFYFYL